jgi:hypothetical protein
MAMNKWIGTTARALSLFASVSAMAAVPPDLSGVWQGKLAVDATTSLTIEFTFAKDAEGAYTAVLHSPDNGAVKNTRATGVTFNGSTVKLQVASLSGAYSGALKDGKITGQWTQPGGTLPLVLSPYKKPVLTKAAIDTLTGTWFGPLKVTGGEIAFVLRFKTDAKGALGGTLAFPEQVGQEFAIDDIQFQANKLTFKIPQIAGDYTGTLANGVLTGTWKQGGGGGGAALPLTMKKGEYAAQVHALKLSTESFAALNGAWKGKLEITPPQGAKVTLNMILRFVTSAGGQYVAFIDSPDQKAMNIPVTEASFDKGKLAVKVAAVQGAYTANLTGKALVGEWSQGGKSMPLTLAR